MQKMAENNISSVTNAAMEPRNEICGCKSLPNTIQMFLLYSHLTSPNSFFKVINMFK